MRKLVLPKCPVCGTGNWPTIWRELSQRRCVGCGSEIEEHATRRHVAAFVLIIIWFVVPVIVVGYTRSSLVILTILAAGVYAYLRITKFVAVNQGKSVGTRTIDEPKS